MLSPMMTQLPEASSGRRRKKQIQLSSVKWHLKSRPDFQFFNWDEMFFKHNFIENKHGRGRDTEPARKVEGFGGDFSQHTVRLRGGIIKQLAVLVVINTAANRMRLNNRMGEGRCQTQKAWTTMMQSASIINDCWDRVQELHLSRDTQLSKVAQALITCFSRHPWHVWL